MQKRTMLRLILVLAMSLLLLNIAAQDDPSTEIPLLEMLSRVPDIPESRVGEMYFNDRVAIMKDYEGALMPDSWAEFDAMNHSDGDSNEDAFGWLVWWRIYLNNSSSQLGRNIAVSEEMEQVTGFDFFDVERELFYGTPPSTGTMLEGRFDLESVRDAYSTLGLVEWSTEGAELWCPETGCEAGFEINIGERNPANPFGGDFGRRQPLVLGDGYLMSSPDIDVVEAHIHTFTGTTGSLADVPEYIAGAEAMTSVGSLMQAMILDGETLARIRGDDSIDVLFDPRMTAEQLQEAIHTQLEDFQDLPVYSLMMLGDTATEDEHIGMVALVYGVTGDADLAANIIQERINGYQSLYYRQPLLDVLTERHLDVEISIYERGDLAVLLVQFVTPKATPEEIIAITDFNRADNDLQRIFPGAAYRLLTQSIFSLDAGWLSTVTRADLEALLDD